MKVWELRQLGLEHLALADRPDPEPGPGQVVVQIRAASLNFRDRVMVEGGYGRQTRLPLVPLSDGAGVVTAVGPGVPGLAAGDRVMTCFFQSWQAGPPEAEKLAGSLGGPLDGTLAERMLLHHQGVVPIPDYLSDEQAATLPCAAVTAYNALATLSDIKPGQVVLVQGTGGVSLFGLQFAKLMGAQVVVTSKSDAKLQRARQLGADHTINYQQQPRWGRATREWTGGRGVDHVLEVGGSDTLAESVAAVAAGGTISLIGVLSGATREINLPRVFLRQIRLQGIVVGSRETSLQMLRAMRAAKLEPVIDGQRFGFDDVAAAFAHLASGQHLGKIVIRFA